MYVCIMYVRMYIYIYIYGAFYVDAYIIYILYAST